MYNLRLDLFLDLFKLFWRSRQNCFKANCYTEQGLESKRVVGIEPTSIAWKAIVLPLNYTRTLSGISSPLKYISISLVICNRCGIGAA